MKRASYILALCVLALGVMTACSGSSDPKTEAATTDATAATEVATGSTGSYKIGIVTPTLTTSEDEFRGAAEMVEKYPDQVVHVTLPENFETDIEGCISQITGLADDPNMKAILVNSGQQGLLPAFQTIRETRPDIITMAATNDDPILMNEQVDISINTDWIRRGITIPTKAHEMGAKTFVHYSFPTHLASATVSARKDKMKETVESLGMTWVEELTPDPQTGNGPTAMLQFLREDIPRKIEQYGADTNIFGSNCPMYDVILDEAFKLKFIVAEQCCPTPTQSYPTVLNLEIAPEDLGDYDKINGMIREKAAEQGMTGRLSGWQMPSSVYVPKFQAELAKYMIENEKRPADVLNKEFLDSFSKESMGVAADFEKAGEGLDNYYLLILEDVFY